MTTDSEFNLLKSTIIKITKVKNTMLKNLEDDKLARYHLKLTQEQYSILKAKARAKGFHHTSEYIRYTLFMDTTNEKINTLYEKLNEKCSMKH